MEDENTMQMQAEEQAMENYEDEHVFFNDEVQNDEERDIPTERSQQTNTVGANLDISDQLCPICMEQWTSTGEHRLCCLSCGHLFGHICILKWLQYSCDSMNRRCPQCNEKATVKDIRMLYAKKLTVIDTAEYNNLKKDLMNMSIEKNWLEIKLSQYSSRLKSHKHQMACMKKRITELESQQTEISTDTDQSASSLSTGKFHFDRSLEICRTACCSFLDYNPWCNSLAISQKSRKMFFNVYGVRKVDCEYFSLEDFIFLHTSDIKDITFHPTQTILLSVSFDKCAKLMDIRNNTAVHTCITKYPLTSCCWSGDNPNIFLIGTDNGSIHQFDTRQISKPVNILDDITLDDSRVVSMARVPPNSGSCISKGGFIACRENSCTTYEVQDTTYLSKPVFFFERSIYSVRYDEKNNHYLISTYFSKAPCENNVKHLLCTIKREMFGEDEILRCNIEHTFFARSSSSIMSRPCYLYTENDTLVAAPVDVSHNISLWNAASGEKSYSLPVSSSTEFTDLVTDLCSFQINNYAYLTILSPDKFRLYNYGQLS